MDDSVAAECSVAGSGGPDPQPSDQLSAESDAGGTGRDPSDAVAAGGAEASEPDAAPVSVTETGASVADVKLSECTDELTAHIAAGCTDVEPLGAGPVPGPAAPGAGEGAACPGQPATQGRDAAPAPAADRVPPPSEAAAARPASRHRCHICGKGFARGGSLTDHLAAHAGTKAYSCGECGAQFQYRDGLLVHRRRHHGGGRLACPHCPLHFEKSCNLRRHLRVHTGERPFECQFCRKRFAQSNGLKKHVRGLHADRVPVKPS